MTDLLKIKTTATILIIKPKYYDSKNYKLFISREVHFVETEPFFF